MKRKLISLLLCLLMIGLLPCVSMAAEQELPRVIDNADLLNSDEVARLTQQINDIRDTYEMDVVIVTTWDLGGKSVQSYADDYYDENGYGYGTDYTGVLLLIAMDTREWYISTCGEAIYALTDYSLDVLGEEMVYFLSGGEYYMAFENFLGSLPKYMIAYRQGNSVDGYAPPDAYYPEGGEEIIYYQPIREPNPVGNFLVALLIGIVVASVFVLIMRSQMNTAKYQKNAANYLKSGSYHLNTRHDLFLYSRVSKTPKPQNHGGSRPGGSSVHRSGGGRSHGGRGGRF